MKGKIFILAILIAIFSGSAFAQNDNQWAVGVKVGEPLGLNIRKYFDYGTKNFDFNLGTYGFLWGNTRKYQGGTYYDHTAGIMAQGIYHWMVNFGSTDRFHAYYGFGGQINSRRRARPVSNNVEVKQISLGGVGNVGMEYTLRNNDMGIFLDGGFYAEAVPKPLFLSANVNTGLRINLRK